MVCVDVRSLASAIEICSSAMPREAAERFTTPLPRVDVLREETRASNSSAVVPLRVQASIVVSNIIVVPDLRETEAGASFDVLKKGHCR